MEHPSRRGFELWNKWLQYGAMVAPLYNHMESKNDKFWKCPLQVIVYMQLIVLLTKQLKL